VAFHKPDKPFTDLPDFSWHTLVIAPIFLAVGSGLFYSINDHTSNANLIGYQILAGIGIGLGMQNVMMAIQYVVLQKLLPERLLIALQS
jgi:hypothetical protein